LTKETLYDRDEFKLIERVCQLRETYPNIKVGEIKRPNNTSGFTGATFELEVEF